MTSTHHVPATSASPGLLRWPAFPYFLIAFVARLPFAMMVVGVLMLAVAARDSIPVGGLTSAAVGLGTFFFFGPLLLLLFGPLLGAAADRFGQRRVLLLLAGANAVALALFAFVAYSTLPDPVLLLSAFAIGATAPQVSPLSRARLMTIIAERCRSGGVRRRCR